MHHFWPGRHRTLAKWEEILVGPRAEETPCVCSFSQNFYKTELNKEEMYIRYIHKLYDLHLKAQNFTGNCLGLWLGAWANALSDALNMVAPLPSLIREEDSSTSLFRSQCILILCLFLSTVFLPLSLHGLSEAALGIMKYIPNSLHYTFTQCFTVLI